MTAYGSLFSGIGGFDLGFDRAGMACKWQVEINKECQDVLKTHWPDVAKFGDIHNVGKRNLEPVNVICGGFPCQDISPASSTKTGINGDRSGLWHEFYRIICEIKPEWVVVENSANLISSNNGDDFREILRAFSAGGYDAQWGVLSASMFGAYHQRKRTFLLAYDNSKYGQAGVGHFFDQAKILEFVRRECNETRIQTPRDFIGMDDGVSGRVYQNRVEMLGNSVYPPIAQFIGEQILEIAHNAEAVTQ